MTPSSGRTVLDNLFFFLQTSCSAQACFKLNPRTRYESTQATKRALPDSVWARGDGQTHTRNTRRTSFQTRNSRASPPPPPLGQPGRKARCKAAEIRHSPSQFEHLERDRVGEEERDTERHRDAIVLVDVMLLG